MHDNQQAMSLSVPVGLSALPSPPRENGGDQRPTFLRGEAGADRVLEEARLRQPKGAKADQVATLLLQKLARGLPGEDEAVADALAVQSVFLRHRFAGPLTTYELGDRFYSYLDTGLNLTSIAAGIGASLLAASQSPKGWTVILGVTIAACQTFSQWLKPAKRAARRGRAAAQLRNEAWDILQGRDRYRDKDMNSAWRLFCDRVDAIEDRQQTVEDNEFRGGSTPTLKSVDRGD